MDEEASEGRSPNECVTTERCLFMLARRESEREGRQSNRDTARNGRTLRDTRRLSHLPPNDSSKHFCVVDIAVDDARTRAVTVSKVAFSLSLSFYVSISLRPQLPSSPYKTLAQEHSALHVTRAEEREEDRVA